MSTLKPVSRVTLAEQVAAQISDQIAEGRWKPGEKLPSEAELCCALRIGRSTLREALKSLAFVGMVQMRPGEGTYVIEESRLLIDRIMARGSLKTDKELQDVGEARLILEGEIAALAAERAEAEDLEQLESIMAKWREAWTAGAAIMWISTWNFIWRSPNAPRTRCSTNCFPRYAASSPNGSASRRNCPESRRTRTASTRKFCPQSAAGIRKKPGTP